MPPPSELNVIRLIKNEGTKPRRSIEVASDSKWMKDVVVNARDVLPNDIVEQIKAPAWFLLAEGGTKYSQHGSQSDFEYKVRVVVVCQNIAMEHIGVCGEVSLHDLRKSPDELFRKLDDLLTQGEYQESLDFAYMLFTGNWRFARDGLSSPVAPQEA